MNPGPQYTWAVIIGTAAFLIAYDIWVGLSYGGDSTISWQIAIYGRKYPMLAAFWFLLGGHFFWQMNMPPQGK